MPVSLHACDAISRQGKGFMEPLMVRGYEIGDESLDISVKSENVRICVATRVLNYHILPSDRSES